MSKIVTDKIQKSGGEELTLPSAQATANNQPLVGATDGQFSFSTTSLPALLATANNQPVVGATTGILSFVPYALPAADGSTGQFMKTDGNGVVTFESVPDPTVSITSSADPDETVAQGALGDFFVNTTSGECFVCTFIGTGTIKRRWAGQLGTYVGYPQGQAIYYPAPVSSDHSPGDTEYTCTVPSGVAKVHVVLVGGGGGGYYSWASPGGAGGALAWANDVAVTAGQVLYITVGGGGGGNSHGGATVIRTGSHSGTVLFKAEGGRHGQTSEGSAGSGIAAPVAGTITPGNVDSGRGGLTHPNGYVSGGGAGGYTGNGGNGEYGNESTNNNSNNSFNPNPAGTGGAGGGGSGYPSSTYGGGGGGGVGLYGEGTSGQHNANNSNSHYTNASGNHHYGYGGSGGENGESNYNGTESRTDTYGTTANAETNMVTVTGGGTPTGSRDVPRSQGGWFGGGGGGGGTSNGSYPGGEGGAAGGARVIWGNGRAFPKTNTGNVTVVGG